MNEKVTQRYHAAILLKLGETLFLRAGLPADRARTVADTLLEGDLLVDVLAENKELCRMASASIRTARTRAASLCSDKN